jgi:hypothetical protein
LQLTDTDTWTRTSALSFGGRKRLAAAGQNQTTASHPNDADAELPLAFQRDIITRIQSEAMNIDGVATEPAPCIGSRELSLALDLSGSGFVSVYVQFMDDRDNLVDEHSIGGTELDPEGSRRFAHRLIAPPGATQARWIVEHRGTARAAVLGVRLGKIRASHGDSATD